MADFTAHYLFGSEVCFIAKPSAAKVIKNHINAFNWGAQGPDPLFFHHASFHNEKFNRYANYIHILKTPVLLHRMADYVKELPEGEEKDQMTAYFYGFLCHYALDRRIHPYVYYHQSLLEKDPKFAVSAHIYIESQLDRYFWRRLRGSDINSFRPRHGYKKDPVFFRRAAAFLACLFRAVYDTNVSEQELAQCFGEMLRYSRLFYSPTGINLLLCKAGDKLGGFKGTLAYHVKQGQCPYDFSGETHEPWYDPWHPETVLQESAWDLFSSAVVEASSLIRAFEAFMAEGTPIPDALSLSTPFAEGCPQRDLDKVLLE